ncbi:MAG: lipid IV(A) 3-deoxy-D-manno-octulosonic acid transferase [Burkholderiaceae bacterium]
MKGTENVARWIRQALYSTAWVLLTPALIVYLLWRSRRQPAYRSHWRERWGLIARRRRRGRPLIWVHAVSVGETRAAEPLIRALQQRYPHAEWLLTCTTPTGREAGHGLFGDTVRQAYFPYDYPWAMRRFLKAWRPSLGIVMETELWPNLTRQAKRLRVPLAAVNVRLSERSLRKAERYGALIRDALARIDTVAAQTDEDAARLGRLGRRQVAVTGNLKFDVTPADAMRERGAAWRQALAGRPVVLAASTRDGEEALLLAAWKRLADGAATRPLLLLVPRHPQRFDEVDALCRQGGWRVVRRSTCAPDTWAGADIVLGDSMGEMFAYYAAADAAIIGGSLLPFGAQNLIEACALGVPVVLGPHTFNFKEAAEQAIACGAALGVADADEAVARALGLVADAEAWQAMHAAALAFAGTHRGATRRTIDALEPLLLRCRLRLEPDQDRAA